MRNYTCCAADVKFHEPTAKEREQLKQEQAERERKINGAKKA